MECSHQTTLVHGILQARKLEWVVISFSRGSSQPKDQTLHCRQILYHLSHEENLFVHDSVGQVFGQRMVGMAQCIFAAHVTRLSDWGDGYISSTWVRHWGLCPYS